MSIINVNLPATDAWKELMERRASHKFKDFMGTGKDMDIEDVKILYKLSEDGEKATLYDIYKDGMKLEGDGIVVPLSSTYNTCVNLCRGTKIVNVKNSSKDILGTTTGKVSWIGIYEFITGTFRNNCCTDGMEYFIENNQGTRDEVRHCNFNSMDENDIDKTVGGHVIVGYFDNNGNAYRNTKYNVAVEPDSDDIVGIMPICSAHNNYQKDDKCMVTGRTTPVVILNYVVSRNIYKDYIN